MNFLEKFKDAMTLVSESAAMEKVLKNQNLKRQFNELDKEDHARAVNYARTAVSFPGRKLAWNEAKAKYEVEKMGKVQERTSVFEEDVKHNQNLADSYDQAVERGKGDEFKKIWENGQTPVWNEEKKKYEGRGGTSDSMGALNF